MSHVKARLAAVLVAALAAATMVLAPATTATAGCRPGAGTNACGYGLAVVVTGAGEVTSSPEGISCRESHDARGQRRSTNVCSALYADGTEVTLKAEADDDWGFSTWDEGCDEVDGNECTVTMDAHAYVKATFLPTHRLDVQVTGEGTVTSDPEGIACRYEVPEPDRAASRMSKNCSEEFLENASVTLTADPDPGQEFTGWATGGKQRPHGRTPAPACSGTSSTCTLTMTDDVWVRAMFAPAPSPVVKNRLAVTLAGTGTGAVTSSPGGIDCGTDCSESYDKGTVVTLTATPATGSTFSGFSGTDCTGTTCTVSMSTAHHVTATFDLPVAPDTIAPETRITSIPRNRNNDHSPFRFRSNEEGSTFQCSIDGAPAQDCASGVDYTCLAPGRHAFQVWATDPAGNTDPTPATRHFRVRDSGRC